MKLSLEQLRQLKIEADRSCLCDGGGTLCGACVAEKKLKSYGSTPKVAPGKNRR